MKLVATSTELAVLRAASSKNPTISGTILQGIDESYFHNSFAQEVLARILKLNKKNGVAPSWRELCDDPSIKEETRKKLRTTEIDKIRSKEEAFSSIKLLHEYRQLRGMFQLAEDTVMSLRKKKVSPGKLLDKMAESIVTLRQSRSEGNQVLNFGKGNNSSDIVKSLLSDTEKNYLPTGFKSFDDENGGISFGNLFVLGGSTGGGKSTLAAQLAINWADMGEDVTVVPLEMSEEEMTARLMANASGLDVRKILFRRLSEDEKVLYWKKYRKFVIRKKKKEGSLRIFKPKSDMTIEEIFATVYPLGSKVVIVDYISLLKGVDGDDAWQKLGAVARYCKIYAEMHNIIVVLLAQVSDDGVIRYARSIAEHCVVGTTQVDTPKGLKTIETFVAPALKTVKGSHELVNADVVTDGKSSPTSHWHFNGKKKVFQLTASNGSTITGTSGHKFLSVNPNDLSLNWVRLGDLSEDSYIALPIASIWPTKVLSLDVPTDLVLDTPHYNSDIPRYPKKLDVVLSSYIGGLLSDGHLTKGGTNLQYVAIGTQEELAVKMQTCCETLFGSGFGSLKTRYTPKGVKIIRQGVNSRLIHKFMVQTFDGLTGGSNNKFIPTLVMQSPKKVAAACLRAMFDGDGTVGNDVSLSSFSLEMIKRTYLLLQKLGIRSHITVSGKRVCVSSLEDMKKFVAVVGFDCLEKQVKVVALIASKSAARSQPVPSTRVPHLFEHVKAKRNNLYGNDLALDILNDCKLGYRHGDIYARSVTNKLLAKLETLTSGLSDKVKAITKYNWVKVKDIKALGYAPVYDITVPETSHYVADGFVTHNSNYAWKFVATAATRDHEIINIEQLKARNGRMFDFTLRAEMGCMRIRDLELEEKEDLYAKLQSSGGNRPKKEVSDKGALGESRKHKKPQKEDSPKNKKSSPGRDYLKDLSDEDEDED